MNDGPAARNPANSSCGVWRSIECLIVNLIGAKAAWNPNRPGSIESDPGQIKNGWIETTRFEYAGAELVPAISFRAARPPSVLIIGG
jgi:hypothetical protein